MKYSINLSSRSYVNKKALYLVYLVCGIVLIAGLFFNAGYFFKLRNQIDTTELRLKELEEKILASQGGEVADYSADRYEKVLDEIKLANGILKRDSFRWTSLLDQLESVIPNAVKIESIAPDYEKNSVKISGIAKELKDMKRFLDNLIKSDHYDAVFLLNQSVEETDNLQTGIKFSINLLGAF